MKVTSFEISRKLAEIGFGKSLKIHYGYDSGGVLWNKYEFSWIVPAYDLETILNALPDSIPNNINDFYGDELLLHISKEVIGYGAPHIYHGHVLQPFFFGIKEKYKGTVFVDEYNNQSIVDCAARLLIKLHETGLVKFEQLTNKEE